MPYGKHVTVIAIAGDDAVESTVQAPKWTPTATRFLAVIKMAEAFADLGLSP